MKSNIQFKKETIIFTAIDIIHEFGIQALSTREVARRAGVSIGTIFHYFSKKDDLILAILDRFSMYDKDIFNTISQKKMSPYDALVFYLSTYTVYYENYPAMISVYQAFDVFWNKPEYEEKVRSIYLGRVEFAKGMVSELKENGLIDQEIEDDILVSILCSIIKGVYYEWLKGNCEYSLKDKMLKTVQVLLKTIY